MRGATTASEKEKSGNTFFQGDLLYMVTNLPILLFISHPKIPCIFTKNFFLFEKVPPPKGRFSPNRRYLGRKNPLVSLQFSLPLGFEKQSLFQNIPRNFSMYLEPIQLRANLFVSAARFETLNPSPSTAPFRFIRFDLHDIIPPFIHLALSLCRRFSHCS